MKTICQLLLSLLLFQCSSKSEVEQNKSATLSTSSTERNNNNLNIPIQELPYSFAGYMIEKLNDEVKYDEMIQKLKKDIDDKESKAFASKLNYNPSLDFVEKQSQKVAPDYYSLILKGDCDCRLINSFLLKRLPSIAGKEVLILGQIIYDERYKTRRGFTLELVIYSKDYSKIEARARLLIAGTGIEDTRFIEAFQINKDYSIQVKSYNSIEGESTTISRNITINSSGNIKESKSKIDKQYSREE